jgi:glycosyltransferase involved in cell wall biosynthesis
MAHQFLNTIGASDFLKNLLRGLAINPSYELIFLCPRASQTAEERVPSALRKAFRDIPGLKRTFRTGLRLAAPVAERVIARSIANSYNYYLEACPAMAIVHCDEAINSIREVMKIHRLDLVLPSVHVLPGELPHITYWPDCQPKHFPEFFDEATRNERDETILGLLSSGRPMVINSRHAKGDMINFYGASGERIYDLPFAPIIEPDKLRPRPELAEPYGMVEPYFIVCNQFWVHKSLETVLEAAAHLGERDIDAGVLFTGRMVEPRKPGYVDGLRNMVSALGLAERVTFAGYIPKDHQIELIRRAEALVQPSLFEGGPGGGSVYDAVALGVRAIVSDIPINRELPQDEQRLLYFEPRNARDLARQMARILSTSYTAPSAEELERRSQAAVKALGARLDQAIEHALRPYEAPC